MAGQSSTRGSVVRFGIGMILAGGLTYGLAGLVPQSELPGSSPSPDASVFIDPAAGFATVQSSDEPSTPLGPPPNDQLIQLVSFNKDQLPLPLGERAPWWTPAGVPRVPQITQFDGGKFGPVNSVTAAGAMLARLGYGTVTTGSQLSSFVPPRRGGHSLVDLERAVEAGWDVRFGLGMISPRELIAILAAGGGVVIIVDYGSIPPELRQQREFTGAHALYVDAYMPSAAGGSGAAFFVNDPMGEPRHGYHGDWWPADVVERAALAFDNDGVAAAWAFAGGVEPQGNVPSLPPGSFPVGSIPSSLGLETPIGDPGPEIPLDLASFMARDATHGGLKLIVDLAVCLRLPAPAFCPPGIPAEYPKPKAPPPTIGPEDGRLPLDVLYADTPQPGLQRVIFSAPPGIEPSDVEPTFSYWPSNGSGAAIQGVVEEATLGGKKVWIATFPVGAGAYNFVASTSQAGVVSTSEVGSIQIGP